MPLQFNNGGQSTCALALTAVQTTAVLASTSGFGGTGNYIVRIDDTGSPGSTKFEYVLVTVNTVGTNTLTFTRAQEGTVGQTFAAGSTFTAYLTAGMINAGLVRLDTGASQTLTGPLMIPPSIGGTATGQYGSMPLKIAETLLAAPAATVTFSSIPSGFRHLRNHWSARSASASADTMLTQFNNDATASYQWAMWTVNESTGAGGGVGSSSATSIRTGILPQSTQTAGLYAGGSIFIANYASTVSSRPTNHGCWRQDSGLAGWEGGAGTWLNVGTAISSIKHSTSSGSGFITNNLFSLYGEP